jgi:mono/diheme cytochrome c family protein
MKLPVLCTSVAMLAFVPPARPARAPTAQDAGWYSAAQADSGADSYYHRCAACHGVHLEGHKGMALVGSKFFGKYGGKETSKLWVAVSAKMPPSAPGSIPKPEALNIIAYIFRQNGLPAGAPLSDGAQNLARVLPSKAPTKS